MGPSCLVQPAMWDKHWVSGINWFCIKVCLHGTLQAAQLAGDMLQCDLLHASSVYMVGSCHARLLHIIHVSAVFEVGVLQENCSRQPVPPGNYKFKLKLPPGSQQLHVCCKQACRRVNAPVVILCFYLAALLSRHCPAACSVPCKCSFRCKTTFLWCHKWPVTSQLSHNF